ncbi:hypothetical protein WJR50_17860 [Catalinimonas sp. 4WD22]|uniref:hypothetical protein n=1 Tax=Catalinimonas locisalis TaxID=3133978 RepID=UPI0031013F2E
MQFVNAQAENKDFQYHVMSSTPVNHLYQGKILGVSGTEAENKIVATQVLKGEMPEGISIFNDGTMAVRQDNKIKTGKYKVKVEFIDSHGNSFIEKIKFKLLEAVNYTDVEASIRIAQPKFTHPKLTNHYKVGDVIAQFHDPDGAIKDAKLVKGSIPPGVMFVQNKKFVVTRPEELEDGEYFFLFVLEDERGGNSVIAASLPIGLKIGELNNEGNSNTVLEN